MTLEQLQEKYEMDVEKSVDEANLSLEINNILEILKIPSLIKKLTDGKYNGIVCFNKYSKQVILDRFNIKLIGGEIPVTVPEVPKI